MKMVIIYGPPGVGKLTVAKKLASETKFKLFHNHLTTDLVASFFEIWSDPFWTALDEVRDLLFTIAADSKSEYRDVLKIIKIRIGDLLGHLSEFSCSKKDT